MPNCTNEPCNTSPVRTKILYMYPIVASQHAQSHTCTLYFATFTPGGKSGNARLISGPMVTYMRNGYMKAAEMGPFYILVREEKAVGGLRSVPAPALSVTTTPVGTATSAPAVAAGPEQVLSPRVCERLSMQLSQELNLTQAKGLYKAVVAGSGDSDSSSKLFLCRAIATALTSGTGRPAEIVLQEVRNYSSVTSILSSITMILRSVHNK